MAPKKTAPKKTAAKKPAAAKRSPATVAATNESPADPAVDPAADDVAAADLIDEVGTGGETHQTVSDLERRLTAQQGIPVSDDQNTLRASTRGPSLLADEAGLLAKDAATKDFISDAHAHCKYLGYVPEAQALLEAVVDLDDGYVALDDDSAIATFLEHCRTLRYWDRTPTVDQT